ncbi:MAG: hypothetical protein ACOYJR_05135 [Acutalibacteraceae bacterium]|jgi:hypothetical protein
MKYRYCVIVLSLLLCICIFTGMTTRSNFTDNSKADMNELGYNYFSFDFEEVDIDSLWNEADLIVVAKFTGNRTARNRCFLSEVEVLSVEKGDKTLEKSTISVYEAVSYSSFRIDDWIADSPSIWKKIEKGFHVSKENNLYLLPGQRPYEVSPLLNQEKDYILFLNAYDPDNILNSDPEKYIFVECPCAKIWATDSVALSEYQLPDEYPLYKDISTYEILLKDQDSYRKFLSVKQKIMDRISYSHGN